MKTSIAPLLIACAAMAAPTKKVLFEITTDVTCHNCPRASEYAKQLQTKHPGKFIIVEHHTGDIMTSNGSWEFLKIIGGSNPGLIFDRKLDANNSATSLSGVETPLLAAYNKGTTADLKITHNYDPATRTIKGTISVNFSTTPASGEYRLGVMLIENGIHSTSTLYKQSVDTGTGIDYKHPYSHRDDLLGHSALGLKGIIPANPQANTTYTTNFEYKVKNFYAQDSGLQVFTDIKSRIAKGDSLAPVLDSMKLVAFISKNTTASIENLNAVENALTKGSTALPSNWTTPLVTSYKAFDPCAWETSYVSGQSYPWMSYVRYNNKMWMWNGTTATTTTPGSNSSWMAFQTCPTIDTTTLYDAWGNTTAIKTSNTLFDIKDNQITIQNELQGELSTWDIDGSMTAQISLSPGKNLIDLPHGTQYLLWRDREGQRAWRISPKF